MTVWIPAPIYRTLPLAYLIIGIAFIAGASYVGYQAALTIIYMSLGLGSIAAGVVVGQRRKMATLL